MANLDIIIVHFKAEQLMEQCLKRLNRGLQACEIDGRILVVDNSDTLESSSIRALSCEILKPGQNLGYGAGINYGVRSCSAPSIVAMNPDVLVSEQCLGHLLRAIQNGVQICGPHLYLDEKQEFLHPPGPRRNAQSEMIGRMSHRQWWIGWLARKAWRKQAWWEWEQNTSFDCPNLCGAILAFSRRAWEQNSGFDETFKLYFEETDFLLRAERLGFLIRKVPEATATHLYDQSCRHQPARDQWYRESEVRYWRRHFGAWFERLCGWLDRLPRWDRLDVLELGSTSDVLVGRRLPLYLELSNSQVGYPAAVTRIENEDWRFSEDVWDCLSPGDYYLRLVSVTGSEVACFRVWKN